LPSSWHLLVLKLRNCLRTIFLTLRFWMSSSGMAIALQWLGHCWRKGCRLSFTAPRISPTRTLFSNRALSLASHPTRRQSLTSSDRCSPEPDPSRRLALLQCTELQAGGGVRLAMAEGPAAEQLWVTHGTATEPSRSRFGNSTDWWQSALTPMEAQCQAAAPGVYR